MYLLRAAAAIVSVFAVAYVALSLAVAAISRRLGSAGPNRPVARYANFLYCLRITPTCAALGLAFLVELPSFLRFEPKYTNEAPGWLPLAATTSCVVFAGVALAKAWRAWSRSESLLRHWDVSAPIAEAEEIAVYEAREPAPLVAVSGLLASRILVSRSARALLSDEELRVAVAHEAAHARRHDNLRRFLLLLCWFPGMKRLDRAWAGAAELAADESAVENRRDALELAAALVKIAGAGAEAHVGEALLANFAGSSGTTIERAERLLNWRPGPEQSRPVGAYGLLGLLGAGLGLAYGYPALLRVLHIFTESLFR